MSLLTTNPGGEDSEWLHPLQTFQQQEQHYNRNDLHRCFKWCLLSINTVVILLLGARHCSRHYAYTHSQDTLHNPVRKRGRYHLHCWGRRKWGQHRKVKQTQLEMQKTWFAARFHTRCSSSPCLWPRHIVFTLYKRTAYRVPHFSSHPAQCPASRKYLWTDLINSINSQVEQCNFYSHFLRKVTCSQTLSG